MCFDFLFCTGAARRHAHTTIDPAGASVTRLLMIHHVFARITHFGAVLQSGERRLLCNLSPRVLR